MADQYSWPDNTGYDSSTSNINGQYDNLDYGFDGLDLGNFDPLLLDGNNSGYGTDPMRIDSPSKPSVLQQPLPSLQQPASASRAASTSAANPTYSFRSDIGFFVPTSYITFNHDPEIGYYTPVPAPQAAALFKTPQTPQAIPLTSAPLPTYPEPTNAGFDPAFPYGTGIDLMPGDFDHTGLDLDYPSGDAPDPSHNQSSSILDGSTAQRKRPTLPSKKKPSKLAHGTRRPAHHKNSIVCKCTCNPVEHIPRAANAFIIFRSQVSFPDDIKALMTNEERVRMIGGHKLAIEQAARLWKLISEQQKHRYTKEAKKLRDEHARKYPNYKYSPWQDLARDFGNENCTCGAYIANMQARSQRAQQNSHNDGEERRPKAFGSRRHGPTKDGAYQVDFAHNAAAESESELSEAPDGLIPPPPRAASRRPPRAAKKQVDYSADHLFGNDPRTTTHFPTPDGFIQTPSTNENTHNKNNTDLSSLSNIDYSLLGQYIDENGIDIGMNDDGLFVEPGEDAANGGGVQQRRGRFATDKKGKSDSLAEERMTRRLRRKSRTLREKRASMSSWT